MEHCILDIILLHKQTTLVAKTLRIYCDFFTSTVNLLLSLRIPFCLRFDTNKWLWDLEGLIWNSTCLAVKTAERNNSFSAVNQTWQDEKSGIIFISLPGSCATLIQFIHVSIREEWTHGLQKKSFSLQEHRSFILLSFLHHMPSITRVFLKQEDQSSGLM